MLCHHRLVTAELLPLGFPRTVENVVPESLDRGVNVRRHNLFSERPCMGNLDDLIAELAILDEVLKDLLRLHKQGIDITLPVRNITLAMEQLEELVSEERTVPAVASLPVPK